jgi:hypothetical protein
MTKRASKRAAKRGKPAGDKLPTIEGLRRWQPFTGYCYDPFANFPRPPVPYPPGHPWLLPAAPVQRLSGKDWIPTAFERRRTELLAVGITEAGRRLSLESESAPDCLKLVSRGYCINELRKLKLWKPKPRASPK